MKTRIALLNGALGTAMALAAATLVPTTAAQAGTVILEGSDAIGFHCPFGQATACQYKEQTFSALGGADPRSIAVIGRDVTNSLVSGVSHSTVSFDDLSTAGNLNNYVAIYFVPGFGCCDSNPAALAGRDLDVANYVNAGGTVEIGNYDGNSAWDFLTGGSGNGAFVAGVGGALSGPSCTDGETVTAAGLTNGFTQPGVVGCWTHQAYGQDHFAALGFTLSFFDADPAFAALNPGYGGFSSLLSNGKTVVGVSNAPEPASWAMMLGGFGLVGGAMRRRRTAVRFA